MRLAEHRGLGLDAADAPAQHGEAVDHGGVAVGADQRVGIGDRLLAVLRGPDDLRQVLEVDLVADAGARRHDAEIVERHLAPAQELVALEVALVLELRRWRRRRSVLPKVSTITEWSMTRSTGTSGLIFLGSPPSATMASRIAARSTTAGTPVKSCISTRAGRKAISLTDLPPFFSQSAKAAMSVVLTVRAVLVAQQVFEQHPQREGQAGEVADLLLDRLEAEIGVAPAADLQRLAGLEAVGMGGGHGRYS